VRPRAIVISRDIPEQKALDRVFGFCVANDVSQRDLQPRNGDQWPKGKSIDEAVPLGPRITTPEEIRSSTRWRSPDHRRAVLWDDAARWDVVLTERKLVFFD